MLYTLSQRRYFKETGKTVEAGYVVELPEEVADEIVRNEGPVLRPARLTTQAAPEVVSAAPRRPGRKPRARA